MNEQDILDQLRDLRDNQRSIRQALWGAPESPDGMVSEIRQIKAECQEQRKEGQQERKEIRRSFRNLGLSVLGSGAIVVLTLVLTRAAG